LSTECAWLHQQLEPLPLIRYPFSKESLPKNGIYFFYEDGQVWGHGGGLPRIVRVGTHRDGNFPSRISEHFLLNESKMNFGIDGAAPKDRSIFRKNIGRALLSRSHDGYLPLWEIDFISRANRQQYGTMRNLEKEKDVEREITKILRSTFSFRFIVMENQVERMGSSGLESNLIGTCAKCSSCKPFEGWLGKHSPIEKIRTNGLWLVQHLTAEVIDDSQKEQVLSAVRTTLTWIQDQSQLCQGKNT